mmetsp:Transcript_36188/g.71157  ORF Transcript_36188/g.71157 Transcript_36188/m.71157 type:complete len:139 (+) Transcript_36188:31-447(+)
MADVVAQESGSVMEKLSLEESGSPDSAPNSPATNGSSEEKNQGLTAPEHRSKVGVDALVLGESLVRFMGAPGQVQPRGTWASIPGQSFNCRVGPNYEKTKQKKTICCSSVRCSGTRPLFLFNQTFTYCATHRYKVARR